MRSASLTRNRASVLQSLNRDPQPIAAEQYQHQAEHEYPRRVGALGTGHAGQRSSKMSFSSRQQRLLSAVPLCVDRRSTRIPAA